MSPIDLYIRRATIGLPKRARLDTAAELRVHLNERATAIASQGLDRSEAEHLAVEYMGPIEPVNRKLLGHFLTARLGWLLVAVLLAGLATWAIANFLFAPAEIASPRSVVPDDVLPLLGDFTSLQITMPRQARTLSLALAQGDGALLSVATTILDGLTADLRPNQRNAMALTMGFPIAAIGQMECETGARPLIVSAAQNRTTSCVSVPVDTGSWSHATAGGLDVIYDTWQPLLVYRPTFYPPAPELEDGVQPSAIEWNPVVADASTWLVLSAYTSRAPLQDIGALPTPPTGSEVESRFPWLPSR